MDNNMNGQRTMPPEKKETRTDKRKRITVILIAVIIVIQIILSVALGRFLFVRKFNSTKDTVSDGIRKSAYNTTYTLTEEANHVSNEVTVSLSNLSESALLEVLEGYYTHYHISKANENDEHADIWYRIPGHGVYTVNLKAGEVLIDRERGSVTVRIPSPAVTEFTIDYQKVEKLLYKDKNWIINGSIKDGESIVRKMLKDAENVICAELKSDIHYRDAARSSAEQLISNMIRTANPELADADIVFEFIGF